MTAKRLSSAGYLCLTAVGAGILLVLLWGKLQLGLVRYFDTDEFAYLHWAHNVHAGRVPIADFLMYAPPGFLYALAPLYAFFSGTEPMIAGRVLMWLIYAATGVAAGFIFLELRGKGIRTGLPYVMLPAIILSILAVPADKMIEIRPDTLSTLFALLSVLFQVRAMKHSSPRNFFAAGTFASLSLVILPKTLPQVLVQTAVFIWWTVSAADVGHGVRRAGFRMAMAGFLVPCIVFAGWIAFAGKNIQGLSRIFYSLTVLPGEVNRLGERFGMQPDLFFYPNPTYYGFDGWNDVLVVNHVLWTMGLMTALVRLLTPYLASPSVRSELLVAGVLFSQVFMFFWGFPLRHAQYLIPIAVYVSVYAADGLVAVSRSLMRYRGGGAVALVSAALGTVVAMSVFSQQTEQKLRFTNAGDLAFLTSVRKRIPEGSPVFDLTGATLYYPDPYYVSAVPFGEWLPYLTRPLPSVTDALTRSGTRFVYGGPLGRLDSLPSDVREYIAARYAPDPTVPYLLVKRTESQ